ncbi:MAG: oligosaccharide flippase family protein, partial [Actinomycetota bacterium]|nr:oligosaccharide flippase family protein [Actinomycetota bacterium]
MDERAIRGVPWTLVTFGSTKVISLLTTVVLARLLVPEDFGLFALATLATLFLTIFRDLGMGSVLILRQDYDRRSQATVVTMMFAMGFLAAGLVVALSPLAALAFDEPRLAGVLAALSLTLVFGGVAWSYDVIMQRVLAFRPRFVAQMTQSLAYTIVAVALAVAGAGVWSLVGGAIAGGVAASVAFLVMAPYRLPLAFDRGVARDALRSGRGFIGQGVLALVRQNTDYLVIGRLLGSRPLGLYTLAYRFGELPYVGIADPVGKVLFPAFSQMRQEGGDIAAAFLGAQRMVALFTCPLGVILSAVAEPFVEAILGSKWIG